MPTKQQLQTQLTTLTDNVKDTIRLLQEHLETPDYTTIRQLGWNLGWHNGLYEPHITTEQEFDEQAVTFTIKVLQDLLEEEAAT